MARKRLFSYRCADVSTGHITKKDAEKLEVEPPRSARVAPLVARYPEGFILYLDPDDKCFAERLAACRADGYSHAFIRLLCRARRDSNYLLRLDADGHDAPGLQQFDW